MKTSIYYGPKDIRIEDVETPKPDNDEVIVRIMSTGICGTDPHIYEGHLPLVKPPVTIGHEASGIVAETGTNITSLNVGDKVCTNTYYSCNDCWYCRNGKKNLCEKIQIIGVTRDGTYSEYVKVPREIVYKFNEKISFDEAAMTDPLACSMHGVERANVKFGDNIVIIGAGPIGLMQLQLSKFRGATKIFSIEKVDNRLKIAEGFGAVPLKPENATEEIKKETNGLGVDTVIESSGSLEGAKNALQMIKKGGRVVIFGAPPAEGEIKIRPYDFYLNEIEIVGSIISLNNFGTALNLIEEGIVDVKPLITHRFPLQDVEEALKLAGSKSNGVIKTIVYSNASPQS